MIVKKQLNHWAVLILLLLGVVLTALFSSLTFIVLILLLVLILFVLAQLQERILSKQIYELLQNGKISQFEGQMEQLCTDPHKPFQRYPYEVVMSEYEFAKGNFEEARIGNLALLKETGEDQKKLCIYIRKLALQDQILWCLFLHHEEAIPSYLSQWEQLQDTFFPTFLFGEREYTKQLPAFVREALAYQTDASSAHLLHLKDLLEHQYNLTTRMLLMMILAEYSSANHPEEARALYQLVIEHGKELALANVANKRLVALEGEENE